MLYASGSGTIGSSRLAVAQVVGVTVHPPSALALISHLTSTSDERRLFCNIAVKPMNVAKNTSVSVISRWMDKLCL